jgi:hypothetical protein
MPAKPVWLLRVCEIRAMLAEVTLPVIDRAIIERVFGLRRRQAIELLNRFGGYQAGRTLLIDRARLIAELDKILAGGDYQQEAARHEKLTAALTKFQRTRRAEEVRIPITPEVFSSHVSTCPKRSTCNHASCWWNFPVVRIWWGSCSPWRKSFGVWCARTDSNCRPSGS